LPRLHLATASVILKPITKLIETNHPTLKQINDTK